MNCCAKPLVARVYDFFFENSLNILFRSWIIYALGARMTSDLKFINQGDLL